MSSYKVLCKQVSYFYVNVDAESERAAEEQCEVVDLHSGDTDYDELDDQQWSVLSASEVV